MATTIGANVSFKKGTYQEFEQKVLGRIRTTKTSSDGRYAYTQGDTHIEEGVLYLTEDEGGLYLGLADSKIKRLQGSVVFYNTTEDFLKMVEPPYYDDVIYYIVESNALIHWNPSKKVTINDVEYTGGWEQLNEAGVDWSETISGLQSNIATLTEQDTILNGKISDNTAEINKKLNADTYNGFVTEYTSAKEGTDKKIKKIEDDILDLDQKLTNHANASADFIKMSDVQTYVEGLSLATAKELADLLGSDSDTATALTIHGLSKALANQADQISAAATAAGDAMAAAENAANTASNNATELGKLTTTVGNLDGELKNVKATADDALSKTNGGEVKKNITMTEGAAITGLPAPVQGADAANKQYVDNKAKGLSDSISSVSEVATAALPKAGGTMTGNITMTTGTTITGLTSAPTNNSEAVSKAYVDKSIANMAAANDAMVFCGVLNSASELPTTGPINIGATYKVNVSATFTDAIDAKVGDLIIYNGSQDITSNETSIDPADWVHVSSGYEGAYTQKLIADGSSIKLTDGIGVAAANIEGTIAFVGASGMNISIASSDNVHTVTISQTWGSF